MSLIHLIPEAETGFSPTHKMGDLEKVTVESLTDILGEPTMDERGAGFDPEWDKVAVEWRGAIELSDGSVMKIAVWDWKGGLVYFNEASIWVEREELLPHVTALLEGRTTPLVTFG